MLSEQQLQYLPQSAELHRSLRSAGESIGIEGSLAMQISDEVGTIDSISQSRIIRREEESLIAQVTVTALRDSPVDLKKIWLAVKASAAPGPLVADDSGNPPVTPRQDRTDGWK